MTTTAGTPARPTRRRIGRADVLVVEVYLLAAVLLYAQLWRYPDTGYLVASGHDQNLFEWMFAAQAHAVQNGQMPLFSALQNAPLGVNLMANTALPALAVPLVPVTLVFGPTVTWAVILTGGLAATASAWYWLFSRHVVRSPVAAAVGAGFTGFAPAVISHAKAHPNFVAAFLLPVIAIVLIRLGRTGRPARVGALLGLLVTLQVLIGEELLLIAVIVATPFAIGLVARGQVTRPFLVGLATAAAIACALLAYPLWWQFLGPQSYHSIEHGPIGNPLAAFVAYPSQSLAGLLTGGSPQLAMNGTEENAYLGWGLVVLVVVLAVWLRGDRHARLATMAAGLAAVLSLGTEITVDRTPTGVPGPWTLLTQLPLVESVLESRIALAAVPAIGCLLALATQRVLDMPVERQLSVRVLWSATLVAALLPLAPLPFEAVARAPTPAFFSSGEWQRWADPGRTIVPAPLPKPIRADALRWQIDAGMGFALPQGYFVGPWGPDRHGGYGAPPRPSAALLDAVADTGQVPVIAGAERANMVADLRFWRADAVTLVEGPHQRELHATLSALLGPGHRAADAWVWDVRPITR
ncbi:MAG: glycosyl transferase [Pseudonocardia sp.]